MRFNQLVTFPLTRGQSGHESNLRHRYCVPLLATIARSQAVKKAALIEYKTSRCLVTVLHHNLCVLVICPTVRPLAMRPTVCPWPLCCSLGPCGRWTKETKQNFENFMCGRCFAISKKLFYHLYDLSSQKSKFVD